jgi:hypothetical protein
MQFLSKVFALFGGDGKHSLFGDLEERYKKQEFKNR